MTDYEVQLLKLIFEAGLAIDSIDEHIEVEQDHAASGALLVVAQFTSKFWVGLEEVHQKLHNEFGIPMHIDYCGEHPDQKIGLK